MLYISKTYDERATQWMNTYTAQDIETDRLQSRNSPLGFEPAYNSYNVQYP